jgi:hypothetical protein
MKRSQRILGYGALALGLASIAIGTSPLFPVYAEAFVIGVAFFAAGAWILAGKELRDAARRAWRLTRESKGASRRSPFRPGGPGAGIDPLLPVRILKLAREHGGILTVAQVAMELNVPLDQAQAGLAECVRAGNAVPDYDIPRSHALYRFPEFIEPDAPRLSG